MTRLIRPMLAVASEPFDSSEHVFEVKWNGIRALAAVGNDSWRLWGRDGNRYSARYPELEVLRRLPPDTIIDGEIIRLDTNGTPVLAAILSRHGLTDPQIIEHAAYSHPVTYVAFDLLREAGVALMSRPLRYRRERLQALLARIDQRRLVFSEGVVGPGREFFAQVVRQGHEGMMAKHLASRYLPGRRSAAWRKIKPR